MTTKVHSELVGRERLLESFAARLANEWGCVVTLRGPGGVGKTALARAVSQQMDGVFVELDVCRDVDDVVSAIAEALLVPDTTIEAIGSCLVAQRAPLVVLDNSEHVLDAVREAIASLRGFCENCRLLVTSRERLGLPGETVIDVAPLEHEDAVRLFELRGREASAEFAVTDENRADVASLIELVDGLPLAIELAASRVRLLEPAAIVERLNAKFKILRNLTATVDRHATLDACVAWSLELLDDVERLVLDQLAIFRGRFGIEEAEGVVECDDWVGDVLESLIEKSLLRVERSEGVQFVPYEGVRRYIESHVPFTPELIRRYALFYTHRMAQPKIRHAELHNVVHAYELAADVDFPIAVKLLMEARHRLVRGGFLPRMFELIDRALGRDDLDAANEAWLYTALSSCHYAVMDYESLQGALDKADAIASEIDLPVVKARVLMMRAIRLNETERPAEAAEHLGRARELLDRIPHDLQAHIYGASGLVALKQGQFLDATQFLDRGVAAANRSGDGGLIARALSWSALGYFASGYRARGVARLEEALDLFDSSHDSVSLAQAQLTLAHATCEIDPDRALDLARAAAKSASAARMRLQVAQCEAMLARLEGGPDAVGRLRRALSVFSADAVRNDRWAVWLALALQKLLDQSAEDCVEELRHLLHAVSASSDEAESRFVARYLAVAHALCGEWAEAAKVLADDPAFLDAMRTGAPVEAFDDPYRRMMHDFVPLPLELWAKHRERVAERLSVEVRADAAALCLPDGEIVDLESRYVLRRLFLAMLEARQARPGVAMTLQDLLEAGWPDETMTYESGIRRVYSAIRNIRRLGLEEIVLTAENGYLLSPEVEFVNV